jgi:hypothetical protein
VSVREYQKNSSHKRYQENKTINLKHYYSANTLFFFFGGGGVKNKMQRNSESQECIFPTLLQQRAQALDPSRKKERKHRSSSRALNRI